MTSSPQKQTRVFDRLSELYQRMEENYNYIARQLGLSCSDCKDNCCVSYFQHHTYIEWAYLWEGLKTFSHDRQKVFLDRAKTYIRESRDKLNQGLKPEIMCPLNENGLCQVYSHRLMICRLHGIPNKVSMPNGKARHFPGCHICQKLTAYMDKVPVLDRTNFYYDLASLEKDFIKKSSKTNSRVNLTIAEMLVKGPPVV